MEDLAADFHLTQKLETDTREGLLHGRKVLEGYSILVVEDAIDTLEIVSLFLERAGANVLAAESADEAWSLLSQTVPDLIISDIAMPGQDGIAFVKELRSKNDFDLRKIPAIALTAFRDRSVKSLALVSGFQDYLHKPVSYSELMYAVLRLTSSKEPVTH